MLSQSAFNAFLKTLEEPPAHAVFILATTEKHKIIPTILSRCQIFDFHRIRVEDIVGYLAQVARLENIAFEEEALNVIAQKADGAMRDALSIFDQVASFTSRNITYKDVLENLHVLDYDYYFRITDAFLQNAAAKALVIFDEILQFGFDGLNFISGLASHLRDLLVCHDDSTLPLLEISEALKVRYKKQAADCSADFLFSALEICSQCELGFKASRNQRLHVELAIIRLSGIGHEKKKLTGDAKSLRVPDIPKSGERKKAGKVPAITEKQQIDTPGIRESQPQTVTFTTVSIKDALQSAGIGDNSIDIHSTGSDEQNKILSEGAENPKTLSEDYLIMCWNAFADQIRSDRPRMGVALKGVKPVIRDDYTILIELNNRSQLDDFNKTTRSDLEKFLRRELQNNRIIVSANLIESSELPQTRLYTNEEKFRYLSQKNPLLASFMQKLNLELE
jgi:DNA polymerase-3 subunit gamma/tau